MKKEKKLPRISLCVLGLIILSSVFAGVLAPYSMEEMNPAAINLAPSAAHIFGTDSMGRDLFTMVLYGGRASIYIGLLSACISTAVAVVYGTVSGLAGERLDDLLMRFSELIMSVPSILLVIFLQAMWGKASWGSLLSMSQEVLLTNCWWIIIIPGLVLITTLVCITEIGEYIRKKNNRLYSNL